MTNAEVIAKTLKEMGIEKVYLYPGGTIAPLLDELIKIGVEYVCGKTEQGAGYMALGAAKETGKPQVVMVTSGPGVTNLTTVVADAYYDSIPLIVFTGQVNVASVNTERRIRQTGFQEINAVGLYKDITKKSTLATHDIKIRKLVVNAFIESQKGRPGPVHIDLPMDVQKADGLFEELDDEMIPESEWSMSKDQWNTLMDLLKRAKRPLIAVGNGVILADAVTEFRAALSDMHIPVVSSLPAVGVLAKNDVDCIGMVGHTGEYYANLALYHADLVVGLGTRLDLRQRGSEVGAFLSNKKVIRIDVDLGELLHGEIESELNIECDVKDFLIELKNKSIDLNKTVLSEWCSVINGWKKEYASDQFYKNTLLTEKVIIESISSQVMNRKVVVTTGVGCHQQFVARYFNFDLPQRKWFTSAGHGTMGYDLPTNIGAVLNSSEGTIGVVIVGDGSFQMNIQELALVKELDLPIKIIVLDDNSLNLVAQFQNMTLGSDPSTGGKINPDFMAIAEGYGIKSGFVDSLESLSSGITQLFTDDKPGLLHCKLTEKEDVLPMLLGGQKLSEMYPFEGEVLLE
ncbi:MAG: thiamine pyrophosphate-binding protein [Fibrobacterales bacterium]